MISFKRHKGRVSSIPGLPVLPVLSVLPINSISDEGTQPLPQDHIAYPLRTSNRSDVIIISKEMGRVSESQLKSIILTFKRFISQSALGPSTRSSNDRTRSSVKGISIKNRIYTYLPVTKKPLEVRMGKGKGSINHYIARIRPNTILFVISNVPTELSLAPFVTILNKLPIKSFIVRSDPLGPSTMGAISSR